MSVKQVRKPGVGAYGYLLLLSWNNVKTVRKNHPDEYIAALRDIEALKARTGLPFTADEQARLATLAVLQSKGMFPESTPKLRAQDTPSVRKSRRSKKKEVQPV